MSELAQDNPDSLVTAIKAVVTLLQLSDEAFVAKYGSLRREELQSMLDALSNLQSALKTLIGLIDRAGTRLVAAQATKDDRPN